MATIRLGEVELKATQVLNLGQSSRVPEHPSEKQFSVSDHIVHEPKEFRLILTLFKGTLEYQKLRALYDKKEPVRFESELDDLDDMVILEFNLSPKGLDAYRAEIRIKQIRKAELKTRIVKFEDPATKVEVETGEDPPGSNTAVSPSENTAKDKPTKQSGKSWAESIITWVSGIFA